MMGRAMEDRVVLKPRSTRPECWIPISFGPVGHHMYHYRRVGLASLILHPFEPLYSALLFDAIFHDGAVDDSLYDDAIRTAGEQVA